MSVVMEGSASTGEIAPHDQNQQPLEMGADKELAEEMKKRLFHCAMKCDWDKVVSIYREHPEAHSAKLIRSGDTALHIAVSFGEESIVQQLVEQISSSGGEPKKSLGIKNDRGNTALHVAAERGSATMCRYIAEKYREGLGVRNNDQETPFLVAALNGKKEAFLCLHSLCPEGKAFPLIRGKYGETILHCAIFGDYFDLAFQIINLYPELANWKTVNGLTPLHVLACKPTAFRSGSRLGWFSKIIYSCILVDKLKEEENKDRKEGEASTYGGGNENLVQNKIRKFSIRKDKRTEEQSAQPNKQTDLENPAEQRHEMFPPNRHACFETIKLVLKAIVLVIVVGLDRCGSRQIRKVRDKKQKHEWSVQVMNELLGRSKFYEYAYEGKKPQLDARASLSGPEPEGSDHEPEDDDTLKILDPPILIAAKNGIMEMVERIVELFPVAIHDTNSNEKNIALVAVEYRQPQVYKLFIKDEMMRGAIYQKVDRHGNSALHLAARLGDYPRWNVTSDALQMLLEWKWYEFVKTSVPLHFFPPYNKKLQNPTETFEESHKELVKKGGESLTKTSRSCSVVATLIASVVFATSSTVPGGVKEGSGTPTLENKPLFDVFAISSLVALCFSVTSLVMFLTILNSSRQQIDFRRNLPMRLLVGMTLLFISIAAMVISFCAGQFFVLKDTLKYAALPVYAVTCLIFAMAVFPFYFGLIGAIFSKVPQRSYNSITP